MCRRGGRRRHLRPTSRRKSGFSGSRAQWMPSREVASPSDMVGGRSTGVAGVPETIGSIVADQDVAALADLAVPGVASRAGEDRVLRDRRPAGQWPGGRGLLEDRPGEIGGQRRPPGSRAREARPRRCQTSGASMNHRASSSRMRWPGMDCDPVGSGPRRRRSPASPGPCLFILPCVQRTWTVL